MAVTRREDLSGEFIKAVQNKISGAGVYIGPSTPMPGARGYTLKEMLSGIAKYVKGDNINYADFAEVFYDFGFDVKALNALPVTPPTIPKSNWFERNYVDPFYILCVALRLEGLQNPSAVYNQGYAPQKYKELFPFDDVVVKVTNTKVFFTYYYNDECVTIPDENVGEFPSAAFLAVLRVAMDGCKTII